MAPVVVDALFAGGWHTGQAGSPNLGTLRKLRVHAVILSTFAAKVKTMAYYNNGVKNLPAYETLAKEPLDAINSEKISGYIAKRRAGGRKVSSINRELQALRRMFSLAQEWGKVEKALPKVRVLPGEEHRERVLKADEERCYLDASGPLLRDVATILIDCDLTPEERFRLRWENVRGGRS